MATDCVNPLVLTLSPSESAKTFNLVVNADTECKPIERYVGHAWSDTASTYTIHGLQITIRDFNNTIGGTVINYNSDEDSHTNNVGTTVHTRAITLENTTFSDQVTVYKDGDFTMPLPLIPGDPYNIEIIEVFDANPEELHDEEIFNCKVLNGNGVMRFEPIKNIVVDCSRTLSFNSDSSTFQEGSTGGSWHTIRVELDAPAGQNIIIPYSLSGNAYHIWNPGQGTGDYFISPSGQPDEIKTRADSSHADIRVWIEDDADPEGDETLVITLGSPSAGADFDSESIITHTLTIKDDDSTCFPVYSFASDPPIKGIEPQTETTYLRRIILSEPNTEDIWIQISLDSSSTASIFDDFVLTGDNVGP
ncbi:MAG: hypothetical protein P8Z41_09505 [Anaerolineales bacterium]